MSEEPVLRSIFSLSAFPKSGVTYLSFLLFHSLFSDDCDIRNLARKYIIDIHEHPNMDFANPQGPRLIKSHFPYLPSRPSIQMTKKAVYLIRHPIDVMMSVWDYGHLTMGAAPGTHDAIFRVFIRRWLDSSGDIYSEAGSWLAHVRSWLSQSDIPVHIVTYQDLVDEPARELALILKFLDLQVTVERQQIAIERSSMKEMAALEKQEVEKKEPGAFFRSHMAAGYDQGHRFVNKGYRNSYESVLTPEERALADKTFGAELGKYFKTRT